MAADCKSAGVSLRRFESSPAHFEKTGMVEDSNGAKMFRSEQAKTYAGG